jgi:predicted ATP-grasp superfamily ATP-dependent carboligase
MRVLIFEYITGGGMQAQILPVSLAREGDLMLGALLRDLSDIAGIRVTALRDHRLGIPAYSPPGVEWLVVGPQDDAQTRFASAIRRADAVWPIAPETEGILERLCQMVETAGKTLLTSPAAAVRLAASKLATLRRLDLRGMPVVPTVSWHRDPAPPAFPFPVVVKPDDGVGCEGATIIRTLPDWRQFAKRCPPRDWILQPLMDGEPLSVSALFAHGRARLLCGNRQLIQRWDAGFVLRGCSVNAVSDEAGDFAALTDQIATAIPELWGYAGVDLLRTADGLKVLEINPRLTSSYAGLRDALGVNPAEWVLNLMVSGQLPDLPKFPATLVVVNWEVGQ